MKFAFQNSQHRSQSLAALLFLVAACTGLVSADELNVGSDQIFTTIEDAMAKAASGDTILVHPLPGNQPYTKVALLITKSNLIIRAVRDSSGARVKLSGADFDYTGVATVPRAIIQFDPAAHNCLLDGFELFGAHNATNNAAGIRINQANNITITRCEIHDNDNGIMSNGKAGATPPTGDRQRIEHCLIHHNGSLKDPGYNHNVYLGGTSVTLLDCEIHSSLTGHNVKSRAHITRVIGCLVYNAAAREFDLVDDAGSTDLPGSDALLYGNVIAKDKKSQGNHTVIYFGQDLSHDHTGTLYLVHNTIATPFLDPVVDLNAPGAHVRIVDNVVWDEGSGQQNQVLVDNRTKSDAADIVTGHDNFFSGGWGPQGALGISVSPVLVGPGPAPLHFEDPDNINYHLHHPDDRIMGKAVPFQAAQIPPELMLELDTPPNNPDLGAVENKP